MMPSRHKAKNRKKRGAGEQFDNSPLLSAESDRESTQADNILDVRQATDNENEKEESDDFSHVSVFNSPALAAKTLLKVSIIALKKVLGFVKQH
mmetsp:Transcript_4999/g.6089  ORF Transcript_4999/g.6089 Transcript_4999/m.6089 type:complete len:94 (+) Transcript_4999:82-363(+)